ncbi:MAG: ACT domain-containing protein [Nitrosopumilus sp.]|nr:ACT domain-containing protein [Nitrosopumilus sp.]
MINYTALAVKIQPEIERILGNSVNLHTVVVAIKRYSDSFENKEQVKEESVLKNARLSLTDGIMDIKFSVQESNKMDPTTILNQFSKVTNNYKFFRMADSFRFLIEDVRQIFSNFSNSDDVFSTGLVKIRISIPNFQNKSDIVSYVAEVLHANGIELVNAFFSQEHIIIILNERDSLKAYDILHSDIIRT